MSVKEKLFCRNCVIKSNYEYLLDKSRQYDNEVLLRKYKRVQRWFTEAQQMLWDDAAEIEQLKRKLWKAEEELQSTREQLLKLQQTHSCGDAQSAPQDRDKQ